MSNSLKVYDSEPDAGYENLVSVNDNGLNSISLLVRGVHCALCIQKIESKLKSHNSVEEARLNFSTGRLSISWQGVHEQINKFVSELQALGYGIYPYSAENEKRTSEKENSFLLLCLGVAGFAMGNLMLLSVVLWSTDMQEMGESTRSLFHWVSAMIAIPTIVFSGRPFFKSAWSMLKQGQTNMDVPISLALILATGMSVFETINHGEHVYFDSAIMLMFFLLIGRYLDFKARRNAKKAATDLVQTLSGFATVLENGRKKRVLIRDLHEGMEVIVPVGEKIPVDGIVQDGESTVDTSFITGETLPRDIAKGDQVFAGTINCSAPLKVIVDKAADNSLLADIVRLMEKAEQGQARYVRLADKAAKLYTPVVHTLALSAFLLWWFILGAEWQSALLIAVTVLIITCPCALGLAVPIVQILATGRLMKAGILTKSGDALEKLAVIDTIIFDKTGTLTSAQPRLIGEYELKHFSVAATLASYSAHPLSQALLSAYEGDVLEIHNIEEVPGKGLQAYLGNDFVQLGSAKWCGPDSATNDETLQIWLSINNQPVECFHFWDQLRGDSKQTVDLLKLYNLKLSMISGDRQVIADKIGKEIGIEDVCGECSPVEKHTILEQFKQHNHNVLVVGDGLNDAPILAGAHVSMAPGSAVEISQNAADIVFLGDKLMPVHTAYKTARVTQKLVKQNFLIAIIYNCFAVPLAFLGFVTPMVAAIAMSSSSLLVIANSYRLRLES